MQKLRARELHACLALLLGTIPVCGAAPEETSNPAAADLARAIHMCAAESDNTRRLACYDQAANRSSGQPPAAKEPSAREPPLAKQVTRDQPAERFGLSAAQVLQKEHVTEAPRKMTAQVVAVRRPPQGVLTLTLSNGQVWAQDSQDSNGVSVDIGDTVTVTHEMMGGFLLMSSASGHRSTPVRRVK